MLEWIQNNLVLTICIIAIIVCLIAIPIILLVKKVKNKKPETEVQDDIIASFGGIENIKSASSRGSRLSLSLVDYSKVDDAKLKEIGVTSSIKMSDKITFVIGEQASLIEARINELKK